MDLSTRDLSLDPVARVLFECGLRVDKEILTSLTALHRTVAASQPDGIEALSDLVNVPDSLGRTPLFYAVSFGEGECTKQLLAVGADARLAETLTGMGPLHVAARAGDTALVMNLLEDAASVELQPDALARNVDGDTALVLACRRLNWPCAQELIRAGGVELPGKGGVTPLHLVCTNAFGNTCAQLIAEFCREGADVNAKDDDGNTPLHAAASVANIAALQALGKVQTKQSKVGETNTLGSGCDGGARNASGETALHVAMRRGITHLEPLMKHKKFKGLLDVLAEECGVPLVAVDNEGRTGADVLEQLLQRTCFRAQESTFVKCCVRELENRGVIRQTVTVPVVASANSTMLPTGTVDPTCVPPPPPPPPPPPGAPSPN